MIFAVFFPANAADDGKQPLVKRIGPSTYRIGDVEFETGERKLFLPVTVNQREGGPLEYALVHENGKVHESILVTTAKPSHVQIALKLLKYQSGEGSVFDPLLPAEDRQIEAEKSKVQGDEFEFEMHWKQGDEENSAAIYGWILDGRTIRSKEETGNPMPDHPWVYTGSMVHNGQFLADADGSIIAIYLDPAAIFNTSVEGSEEDERWGANHLAIPEIGTEGTLVIKPVKN